MSTPAAPGRDDDEPLTLTPELLGGHVRSVAAAERERGPYDPEALRRKGVLAALVHAAGLAGEPDGPLLRKAIEQYRELHSRRRLVFGSHHEDTLSTCHDLGSALLDANRPHEAQQTLAQALAGRESVLGTEAPESCTTRFRLAEALLATGETHRAMALLKQTVRADERRLPLGDEDRRARRAALFWASYRAGLQGESIELAAGMLRETEQLYGPDHLEWFVWADNLANAHHEAGDPAAAIPWYERALHGLSGIFGPEDARTLLRYRNLAVARQETGDLGSAIELVREARLSWQRMQGPRGEDTLATRSHLAELLFRAGRHGEAAIELATLVDDLTEAAGPGHPALPELRARMRDAHRLSGPDRTAAAGR
ncbi:tetratricopeptide repeat protein [Streptomyces sp. NPDC059076]|uniref:tetratricopeptide repeat protein n=1 Tax=unclassified Streptomyces TaxID=2593676 RepID=UPI0036C4854A